MGGKCVIKEVIQQVPGSGGREAGMLLNDKAV